MPWTRKIEIFSAGCAACEATIAAVGKRACPSCDIVVLDMKEVGVAASAGLGGTWLGNLGALVPYRSYLLGVAAVGLGIARKSAMRRLGRRTCGSDGGCGRRPPRRWTFGVLALSTLLVMFAAASNWLEPLMVEAILGWARTS